MFNINIFAETLLSNLIFNAPVRTKPPAGPVGKPGTESYSPYPGNLRQNGINLQYINSKHIRITVGGAPAGYGPYTETRSHKPGWIAKSINNTANTFINKFGGKIV